jgi:hypothetical protein
MGPGHVDARTYTVGIESGSQLIAENLASAEPELRGPGGRLPGPYKVDTVPVFVEDDYVIIDD